MDTDKYKKIIKNAEEVEVPSIVKSRFYSETMKKIRGSEQIDEIKTQNYGFIEKLKFFSY